MKSVLILLFLPLSVFGQNDFSYVRNPEMVKAQYCKGQGPSVLKNVSVKMRPNFFFRYLAGRDIALFASSARKNFALNLSTSELTNLPGVYDPVPLWGEDVLTTPAINTSEAQPTKGLEFYDLDKLMAGKSADQSRLLVDETLGGVYQSVGHISVNDKEGSYVNRVITDAGGVSMRDYLVKRKNGKVKAVVALGKTTKLCKNFRIKTPMLSKNGQELAGFDVKDGVSKIWKINPDGSDCEVVQNLGYATGKVDFSFDGRHLVFHMNSSLDSYSGTDGQYSGLPEITEVTNVFVLDRKTKELKQLTFNSDVNSYYPVWSKDGNAVYLNYSNSGQMSFSVAQPLGVPGGRPIMGGCVSNDMEFCKNMNSFKRYLAEVTVGVMWTRLCTAVGDELNPQMASLAAKNIERNNCKEMIKDLWHGETPKKAFKQLLVSYNKEAKKRKLVGDIRDNNVQIMKDILASTDIHDLIKTCEDNPVFKKIDKEETKTVKAPAKAPGLKLMEKNCLECHSYAFGEGLKTMKELKAQGSGPLNEELSWAQAAVLRLDGVGGQKMPLGHNLSEAEYEEIKKFLSN